VRDIGHAFTLEEATAMRGAPRRDYANKFAAIIGRVYNLTFNFHSYKRSRPTVPGLEEIVVAHTTFIYRCSQRQDLAKKRTKVADVSKQRQRRTEARFPCHGRLSITFSHSNTKDCLFELSKYQSVTIPPGAMKVHFYHEVYHEGRERVPFPAEVREFIRTHYRYTCREMHMELITAKSRGQLESDITLLTSENIRYWWSQIRKERIETDPDPWISAVSFLRGQREVSGRCIVGAAYI
jgi:hypothetical protein